MRLYVNYVRMESCISIGVMGYMLVYEAGIREGRVMGFELCAATPKNFILG